MTNLHTDATETTRATRRRQLTRALTVGAFAAGAAVSLAVPALASVPTGYHVAGTGAGSRVVSDPRAGNVAPIATLADGTSLTIDCGTRGRSVHGDSVWHHITSPVTGYLADYYTDTPGFNQFIRGEVTCPPSSAPQAPATAPVTAPTTAPTTAPATPVGTAAPAATRGATISYNEGYGGSCVYYALDRFHQLTGVYPKALGDAKYLADSAAANGWTVGTLPRINSLAVFQPGQNGAAAPTGHAAWVEQISGDRIYVAEMNAPNAWVVTHRWLTPATGVRYIYTP